MTMLNTFILLTLALLLIFTPIAFGGVDLWAFSIMELGILLMIILWATQSIIGNRQMAMGLNSELRTPNSKLCLIFLSLFLLLILFQMLPLPAGLLKVLSPRTFELRNVLSVFNSQLSIPHSQFPISFVPFLTKIEFFKWLALIGLFLFLLKWRSLDSKTMRGLVLVVFGVGVFESLYGMFEFFSGHRQILHLKMDDLVTSVTGTFINRNAFAGYLLMAIPLSMGYLFSRGPHAMGSSMGWRHRLSSLDGKSLLIGFGVILMILGLLFSASRMGIVGLLLSFSLISLLFRNPEGGKRFSRPSILILSLAVLWAAWVGLDAVISRFFSAPESFGDRWRFWVSTFHIIKDYPLFGTGLGTFTQVFPMYRSFHIRGLVTHAENDFLQLASEAGLVGAGLLLILFIYLFYRAISGLRSLSRRDPARYVGIGGLIGILALMFHSLVERNIQIPANAFLYTFLWGIVLRIGLAKKRDV